MQTPKACLKDGVEFDKDKFAAYANSVTLGRMLLLSEEPVDGEQSSANQLSRLYTNFRIQLHMTPATYDFSLLDLNGAHGGNIMTTTLPGVHDPEDRPWLVLSGDNNWRTDSMTTTDALFRVSKSVEDESFAVWKTTITPDADPDADEYRIYATWRANVTQKTDNRHNYLLPDDLRLPNELLSPAPVAAYFFYKGEELQPPPVIVDQRTFATDLEHEGLAYAFLGSVWFTVAGDLTIKLSNIAQGHVIAGPILIENVKGNTKTRIQRKRDPETLDVLNPTEYSDDDASWTDLVYETGSGKYPLWESVALRPVFRELFIDWRNTDWRNTDEANQQLDFPSLGDAPSPDPNFPTSIYFDTAESDLTADDKFILDGFAEFLLGDPLSQSRSHRRAHRSRGHG